MDLHDYIEELRKDLCRLARAATYPEALEIYTLTKVVILLYEKLMEVVRNDSD